LAATVCVLAVRIDDQVPVEATERDVIGLQLAWLRLAGREHRCWHPDLGHVDCPHIRHGQLQLKLTIRIGEITTEEIRHGDVAAIALRWRLIGELDAFAGEALVHGKVFPIQQRKREIHVNAEVS